MNDEAIPSEGSAVVPPSIPRRVPGPEEVPPAPGAEVGRGVGEDPQTLKGILVPALQQAFRSLPKALPKLGVFLGVVFFVNFILMQVNLAAPPPWMPSFMMPILNLLVFATAAQNTLIPRTLFWVIAYKFGKHLLRTARREGWDVPAKNMAHGVSTAIQLLQDRAAGEPISLLLGAAVGLVGANYLSGEDAGRSAAALLIAVALVYQLGVQPNMFISLLRAGTQDLWRFFSKGIIVPRYRVQLAILSAAAGMILSLFFMLIGAPIVGHIAGGLALLAAVVLPFVNRGQAAGAAP